MGKCLSRAQIKSFIENGFIHLSACLDKEFVNKQVMDAYERLSIDPNDEETWPTSPLVHMDADSFWSLQELSPKAWGAICDLLGGPDRIKEPVNWGNNFIINFSLGRDRPWIPPSSRSKGWHKDGDFFWHFLDSPEQALLVLVIWKDIVHQGGGTYLALDSINPVSQYLIEHPEGLHPFDSNYGKLIKKCNKFHEVTGNVGDVLLIHPFMLHSSSQNLSGTPRLITNPVVSLNEPMNFSRNDINEYSAVERGTLYAIHKNELAYSINGKRRAFDHSNYEYLKVYWPEEYNKL